MYKDKDKQREAQRDWVRQKRAKAKGSTDYEILESWAHGEGTEYQRGLGQLARHYRPDTSGLDAPERNAQTRERLRATPVEALRVNGAWIPVWRTTQG